MPAFATLGSSYWGQTKEREWFRVCADPTAKIPVRSPQNGDLSGEKTECDLGVSIVNSVQGLMRCSFYSKDTNIN
ncbi:hypothetical protein CFAM422_000051 [Trichoderma lentiforme]|uniref:Uncharacterized protein n=1 Tax=Trichoderma lentiforme TaxID=1567552 RepID=A0A9P4XQZ0_9HYPO|nr:hypothetical protein CFAM422_000051 [Trichoderma lentiforme]